MLNNSGINDKRNTSLLLNKLIFKKYKPIKLISEGNFSQLYLVVNEKLNKFYAMKAEKKDSNFQLLEQEAYNLYSLKGIGIPELITYGKIPNYSVLIEELLDKSLYELFLENNYKFPIQDICLIAIQLIDRIEWVHSKTLIHRDIKPENFLIGKSNPNTIYLTEFGLCSKYCSSKTGKHILPGFRGTFTGTLKYSSANAQRGNQQSRRDDMESLGYTLLFFMKGKLPWQNLNKNFKEKEIYFKTYAMKKFMPIEKLCKGLPTEMEEYFKYIKTMKFQEEPNYDYLRNLFKSILKKNGFENLENIKFSWVDEFQWVQSKMKKKRTLSPKARLYLKIKNQIQSNKELASDQIRTNVNISYNKKPITSKNNNTQSISFTQPNLENINISNNIKPNNDNFALSKLDISKENKEKEKIEMIKKQNEKKAITNRELKYNEKYNTNMDIYNKIIINENSNNEEMNNSQEGKMNNYNKNINENVTKKKYNYSKPLDYVNIGNNNEKQNTSLQFNNINPNVNVYNFNIYNNRYPTDNNQINYKNINKVSNIQSDNDKIHIIRPKALNKNRLLNLSNINNKDNLINLEENNRVFTTNKDYIHINNNMTKPQPTIKKYNNKYIDETNYRKNEYLINENIKMKNPNSNNRSFNKNSNYINLNKRK